MLQKILRTLEFDKIIERLESCASTSMGKELARELAWANDLETVLRLLQETDEAMKVNRIRSGVSFGGIRDIRPALRRAKIGGILSPQELLDTAQTLFAARTIKRELLHVHKDHPVPLLAAEADAITEQRGLEKEINDCIDENADVRNDATPELARIRREIVTGEARIREKIEAMIRNPSTQKMLQEQLVTLRNGRYVIPVKQEYRAHFGGIIHDQSSSGATLFIEPEAIVQMNNRLRELRLAEEKEVEKILRRLSARVGEQEADIRETLARLARIDFIFAKADLAEAMNATLPMMNDRGYFQLKKARHPLIAPEDVRPIDVELGENVTMLVITGPNTGGKTVTLKTIGLLHLMAMSGLFVPAAHGSQLCVFDHVFADIGDEQSIEQNLSTFSSHMTNIVRMLEHLTSQSLILLDELGAGTDPTEGAALAMAILEHLREVGCRVVATTHYSELKAYAYEQEGIMNASMEFDIETLRPTYRLLLGVPGRSNAFAIAERLGLPREIIEKAREQVGEDDRRLDTMIASLERNRATAETEREEAERLRREVEQLKRRYEEQSARLEEQREKILRHAEAEAKRMVEKAQQEAEQIIADLRKLAMEEQVSIKEHKLIEAKKRLDQALPQRTDQRYQPQAAGGKREAAGPGDEVYVLSLGQKGYILEEAGGGQWLVQLGIMKMKVNKDDVQLVKKSGNVKDTVSAFTKVQRADQRVRTELDLRGATLEDALIEVDRFLDEAILSNLNQVAIIHGKGTGVLRNGIQEYLRKHKHVKHFRPGGLGEGGSGVTIAELG